MTVVLRIILTKNLLQLCDNDPLSHFYFIDWTNEHKKDKEKTNVSVDSQVPDVSAGEYEDQTYCNPRWI